MNTNKLSAIYSLIENCEANIKSIKALLVQVSNGNGATATNYSTSSFSPSQGNFNINTSSDSFVEGYFDGENMVGDNGNSYPVPQNYISKTQLIIGDRMKWSLATNAFGEKHEMFKLIDPAPRKKVIGRFLVDGNNFFVTVDSQPNPIKIIKASATYAMKNLGLKVNDLVAIYIPKTDGVITHGAFVSVVGENDKVSSGLHDQYIDNFELQNAEPVSANAIVDNNEVGDEFF
jgi:hypothetical protein